MSEWTDYIASSQIHIYNRCNMNKYISNSLGQTKYKSD